MPKTLSKLPKYGRVANPPAMRFTQRDAHILEAIHAYDGILSFSQIQRLLAPGQGRPHSFVSPVMTLTPAKCASFRGCRPLSHWERGTAAL
jgi:hypothetical protein